MSNSGLSHDVEKSGGETSPTNCTTVAEKEAAKPAASELASASAAAAETVPPSVPASLIPSNSSVFNETERDAIEREFAFVVAVAQLTNITNGLCIFEGLRDRLRKEIQSVENADWRVSLYMRVVCECVFKGSVCVCVSHFRVNEDGCTVVMSAPPGDTYLFRALALISRQNKHKN